MNAFYLGFFAKTVASIDDTLTRIPVLAALTVTLKGKFAFSVGTVLANTAVIALALLLGRPLARLTYAHGITAGLIVLLAFVVYFELLVPRQDTHRQKKRVRAVATARFLQLVGIGFLVSLATLVDDTVVLLPLFAHHETLAPAVVGVYAAAFLQIAVMIWGGKQLDRFRYKKEAAALALLLYAGLVYFQVV